MKADIRRIFIGCAVLVSILLPNLHPQALEQSTPPPYAKWGQLAMKTAKEKYPNAKIIDYLHIGREKKTETSSVEKFKLWLKDNGQEFGLYIDIEFNPKNDQVKHISIKKVNR